jgi:hypothetical protein
MHNLVFVEAAVQLHSDEVWDGLRDQLFQSDARGTIKQRDLRTGESSTVGDWAMV